MSDTAASLRNHMVDQLVDRGQLHDPAWEKAVRTVPREAFLPAGYFDAAFEPGKPTVYRPVLPGADGWLPGVYRDTSLVTQLDGRISPADAGAEELEGMPTSSTTLPSLVLRMLEDAQIQDSHRVLEIGTGTGYSGALMCERLGDGAVASIEIDAGVSQRAGLGLASCGYHPELVVGDGLVGWEVSAPYDRVIATCQVTTIPQAWIEQTRPGGVILATVGGWLHSSELARLHVDGDGNARGRLLGGQISFMLARPQSPPPFGMLPDLDAGEERPTSVGADLLGDWTARFVMQLAAPKAQRLDLERNGRTEHVLLDVEAGAWAALWIDGDRWLVREGGPYPLWRQVEETVGRWQSAHSPGLDQFAISVVNGVQTITWEA